jgi:nitroreductase
MPTAISRIRNECTTQGDEMDLAEAIDTRSSAIRLTDPPPAKTEIIRILEAGLRAPDHGRLAPTRFVVFSGDGLEKLADAMVASFLRKSPAATVEQRDMERKKVFRAPLIIAVAAHVDRNHKVPPAEQLSAVAAGVQNMFLTAHSLSYGVMWKTGAPAYDPLLNQSIGLSAEDQIIAFLYLGTLAAKGPVRSSTLDGVVIWA